MVNRSVADILRAAKARIGAPERWFQCWSSRNVANGARCAALAIADDAPPGSGLFDPAIRAFAAAVGCAPSAHEIGEWNDSPERTHAEVMAAFDRAIAAEEAS